jgi:hypothetical protein
MQAKTGLPWGPGPAVQDRNENSFRDRQKSKETLLARLLWVIRFGGCLQVEQLCSSGAKSGLLHLLTRSVRS